MKRTRAIEKSFDAPIKTMRYLTPFEKSALVSQIVEKFPEEKDIMKNFNQVEEQFAYCCRKYKILLDNITIVRTVNGQKEDIKMQQFFNYT